MPRVRPFRQPPTREAGLEIGVAQKRSNIVRSRDTTREAQMAVAFVQEFPIASRSTENYDYIAERLGDDPVDGLLFHSAGFDDDDNVFRIFDIWESQEQAQRFLDEQIQPLMP